MTGAVTVFRALGDPTRAGLVRTLSRGPATEHVLAAPLPVTRQAVAKHLAVLREAGLVESRRAGRETVYRLRTAQVHEAEAWLAEVAGEWERQLAVVKRAAES